MAAAALPRARARVWNADAATLQHGHASYIEDGETGPNGARLPVSHRYLFLAPSPVTAQGAGLMCRGGTSPSLGASAVAGADVWRVSPRDQPSLGVGHAHSIR